MENFSVIVEVSARHIHLNRADLDALFGEGYELTSLKELSQTGHFAAEETVDIIGSKRTLEKVRILGPLREKSQLELSKTDCYYIGLDAPLRLSGDLDDAAEIKFSAINQITVNAAIIAKRHFHCSTATAGKHNLKTGDKLELVVEGERAAVLEEIIVRVADEHNDRVHLDTDEANAVGIKNGEEAYLIIK